ncbi:TetR/AcrR family transcriptional regulator [Streptomyces ficellus]|uniref:TetR/AcrR family transcriptional regulator n=1 Tax=Streptomyces ficellus TaxID=1977088 RepID=A0A6I6FQP5_9ACTN|nr:TetR/AcrR family transcriptional regulator [Streptomyces ficellus]QGV79928.1 TetR/AcrR family transcriptional regulator [Streptomyces ficellus]
MPAGDTTGRRASDKGRYGRLTRERVLAVALGVVDAEGLSALSMRRLGSELGVEAMSLYRYLPGKDALLDGMVEALYQEVEEHLRANPDPAPDDGPTPEDGPAWRAGLRHIARATYAVGLRHPEVVPLLATRMLSVPLARRPAAVLRADERILRLLHEGGLDEPTATAAHRAFTAWLLGYLLVELRAMVDAPEEPDPAFRLGLHRMPAQDFPRLRAGAAALAGQGGHGELTAGIDALLDRVTTPTA